MKKFTPFLVVFLLLFAAQAVRGETIYKVKRGDSLWKIAKRYRTSVRQIERGNRFLHSPHRLKPGERLRIAGRLRQRRIRHIGRRRLYRRRISRLYRRRTSHLRASRPHRRKFFAESGSKTKTKTAVLSPGTENTAPGQSGPEKAPRTKNKNAASPDKADLVAVARISDVPALKTIASGDGNAKSGLAKTGLSNAIRAAIVNSMVRESKRGKGKAGGIRSQKAEVKVKSYHRVKRGDTLYSIAKRNDITISRLRELNHIRAGRTQLKPGKRLMVGVKTVKITEKRISRVFYTVRPGDDFYRIAGKFNLRPEQLEDLNEIAPTDLQPGMKIRLRASDRVIPRETVKRIRAKIDELRDSKAVASLSIRARLLLFAKAMLNVPYRFGGASFYGIDCSAFVQRVYKMLGIHLPRTARQQYREGVPVSLANLAVGDLLFFRTYASFPSHVGIYIGRDLIVYASSGRCKVRVGRLRTPYFMKRLIGAKRILFNQEMPAAGN